RRSSDSWSGFAQTLREETGADVAFQRPGGFHLCLSEGELEARAATLKRLHNQPRMLPQIGPEVAGGSYCPLDGHCNSLRLLRALHAGMEAHGAAYLSEHHVER